MDVRALAARAAREEDDGRRIPNGFPLPGPRGTCSSMFDAVRFHSYKCLADVAIELGRMTLLVGANASGKSSVLDGLHLLCQLGVDDAENRPSNLFSGSRAPERLRTF